MAKGETLHGLDALAAKFNIPVSDDNKKPQSINRNGNGNDRRPPKGGTQRSGNNRGGNRGGFNKKPIGSTRSVASAPYNFVPLPADVLPAPLNYESGVTVRDKYASYVQRKDLLSGVIELSIETKTPFFIGAGKSANFFAPPGGNPIIPGSTMRGMVKNIMKILACGAMRPSGRKDIDSEEVEGDGDFFDRTLYYRGMAQAAGSGIREAYNLEMQGRQAGYLIRCIDKRFYICPAQFSVENGKGDKQPSIRWETNGSAVCFTGPMGNKKHHTLHFNPDWDTRLPVDDSIVRAYKDDATRKGLDLIKNARKDEQAQAFTGRQDIILVAPCFYVADGDTVRHFGFGQHYRIPYQKSIADHLIPSTLSNNNKPDFTDALFGRKEDWGSRLFFEDCTPVEGTVRPMGKTFNCILGTPNPTSAQLYLEQKDGNPKTWNDDVPIRGYKFYWHQPNEGKAWEHHTQAKPSKVTTSMRPIASGAKFQGKIRFERLSEIELGALLKVFELSSFAEAGEELCFKLGRGKSIGMGSVIINATLRLIDKKTYAMLFDGDAWNKGLTEAQSLRSYTQKFDDYLNEKLDKAARAQYDISQKALITMLDWKKTELPKWETETAMMTLESKNFNPKIILPDVEGVINRAKGQAKP